jgi:hypothetical protein
LKDIVYKVRVYSMDMDVRTRVCVPVVLVMRAVLFADELLIHDFFKLDHFSGVVMCIESLEEVL